MDIRLELARTIRDARRDSALTLRQVATAAGVSVATVHDLENAAHDPGLEVTARVMAALGGRLRTYMEPGTGPLVHDRFQAPMVGALVRTAGPAWARLPEVGVDGTVHGVIDLVLERRRLREIVAVESESGLRRIEQQVRWARAKADALSMARGGAAVSRLMLLRLTTTTRAVAATYPDVLAVAYPSPPAAALAALTGDAPWPGPALIWCRTFGDNAELLDVPPRGLALPR